jgi:hypothetical protein
MEPSPNQDPMKHQIAHHVASGNTALEKVLVARTPRKITTWMKGSLFRVPMAHLVVVLKAPSALLVPEERLV